MFIYLVANVLELFLEKVESPDGSIILRVGGSRCYLDVVRNCRFDLINLLYISENSHFVLGKLAIR